MKLKEYKERLNKHDWYYMMSEDPRWYDSGHAEENELRQLAETKPSFKKAFDAKYKELFPSMLRTHKKT